jgi:hypothetical protein
MIYIYFRIVYFHFRTAPYNRFVSASFFLIIGINALLFTGSPGRPQYSEEDTGYSQLKKTLHFINIYFRNCETSC